jgi:hypothetical protein
VYFRDTGSKNGNELEAAAPQSSEARMGSQSPLLKLYPLIIVNHHDKITSLYI